MENASKALIISGSILIAIVLIAFGIKTFNSTSDTVDAQQTQLETSELEMFNNKFYAYIGNKKTASEVKALANLIIATNASISDPTDKVVLRIPGSFYGGTTITTYDPESITNAISNFRKDIQYRIIANKATGKKRITEIRILKATP